jgi:hypothetical protein
MSFKSNMAKITGINSNSSSTLNLTVQQLPVHVEHTNNNKFDWCLTPTLAVFQLYCGVNMLYY